MKVKAEKYNEKMEKLGYVVRYAFGKWVVCDGKVPDGMEVNENDIFIGYPVKWFDTMKEADELRDILNK